MVQGIHVRHQDLTQSTMLPVGVAIYGQIPPTLWVSAQSGTLRMSCMSLHQ
ncbi:Uncharacterised protein [Salmonella enterica subsp. houtenae serovar Houten]|nr:Uncharacterised protein [Salmonella enterica subsp. houtenae serovar Houten]VFS08124.1 Uncharacterised protein [Salmonella enterica subsp. houtenae]